jgi:hypothetical protein
MARDQLSLFSNSTATETAKPKWHGSEVDVIKGDAQFVLNKLPRFERRPFAIDNSIVNVTRDVIVRCPDASIDKPVPVGVVSKSYSLLQHTTLLETCVAVINGLDIKADTLDLEAWVTQYGERVQLRFRFPREYRLDPGDGYYSDLELVCNNSVDGSLRLSADLMWYRQICGNGMYVGSSLTNFTKVHNRTLDIAMMTEAVKIGMEHVAVDRVRYREWRMKQISKKHFNKWIDGALVRMWGIKSAARIYHIVIESRDCEVIAPSGTIPPTHHEVRMAGQVPGMPEGEIDLYAVSQAMSWLAGQHRDIAMRDKRIAEIPELLSLLGELK